MFDINLTNGNVTEDISQVPKLLDFSIYGLVSR